jgi:hypothetical protein
MPPRNFFMSWGVVAVTSAPKLALATLIKYWSFIRPTSIFVGLPVHASSSALIKSFASMPAPFAKSLAVPSGRIPSDAFGRLSPLIMALTTAFRVPSPPPATIRWAPSLMACRTNLRRSFLLQGI